MYLHDMLKFAWQPPADNGGFFYNYLGELYEADGVAVLTWDAGGTQAVPSPSDSIPRTQESRFCLSQTAICHR